LLMKLIAISDILSFNYIYNLTEGSGYFASRGIIAFWPILPPTVQAHYHYNQITELRYAALTLTLMNIEKAFHSLIKKGNLSREISSLHILSRKHLQLQHAGLYCFTTELSWHTAILHTCTKTH